MYSSRELVESPSSASRSGCVECGRIFEQRGCGVMRCTGSTSRPPAAALARLFFGFWCLLSCPPPQVLGLSKDCSDREVTRAYRKQVRHLCLARQNTPVSIIGCAPNGLHFFCTGRHIRRASRTPGRAGSNCSTAGRAHTLVRSMYVVALG